MDREEVVHPVLPLVLSVLVLRHRLPRFLVQAPPLDFAHGSEPAAANDFVGVVARVVSGKKVWEHSKVPVVLYLRVSMSVAPD